MRSATVATRPHTRIVQRRDEVQRRAESRRLRIVMALTLASTLVVAAIGLVNSAWFDVDQVEVTGLEQADRADIIYASGIYAGQPLHQIDLEASAALVEQVPWVGAAEVRRSWTGDIEIVIVERGPVAALATANGFALIDHWGRQLAVVDSRPEGYVTIAGLIASGVPGQPAPAEATPALRLVAAMVPSVAARVSAISLSEDGELVADLTVGGEARFGGPEDIELKVQALETVLERVQLECLAIIDLAVPSAPSVTRIGEGAATAGAVGDDGQEPNAMTNDC